MRGNTLHFKTRYGLVKPYLVALCGGKKRLSVWLPFAEGNFMPLNFHVTVHHLTDILLFRLVIFTLLDVLFFRFVP